MRLELIVTRDELCTLVSTLTPTRIVLDEARGRVMTLGPPRIDFVPGRGLRLRGDARISWDAFGVTVPITIQAWQILLVPWVRERGRSRVLGFEPILETLDLKGVPSFIDGKIAEGIKTGIAKTRERLAWDFARSLSKRLGLPARVEPLTAVAFDVTSGEVVVTDTELRLVVRLEARAERRVAAAAPESVRAPASVRAARAPLSGRAPLSVAVR